MLTELSGDDWVPFQVAIQQQQTVDKIAHQHDNFSLQILQQIHSNHPDQNNTVVPPQP